MTKISAVADEKISYRKVLVRVEDRLWRAVRHFAAANDIQPSQIVRRALRGYLDEQKVNMEKIDAFSEELSIEHKRKTPAAEGRETHDRSKRRSKGRGSSSGEKRAELE